jgi:hypothetical protein
LNKSIRGSCTGRGLHLPNLALERFWGSTITAGNHIETFSVGWEQNILTEIVRLILSNHFSLTLERAR